MEHRRKRVLRPPQPLEQRRDPFEPEAVAGRREPRQSIELRLNLGIGGAGKIRHQAASFVSGERYEINRPSLSLNSPRETTMSMIPCSSKYSARWKPSGSFSR